MQILNPPSSCVNTVRNDYKGLLAAAAQAYEISGKDSAEYAACTISLSTYVSAIAAAYGFATLKEAHAWLRKILS